MEDPVGGEVIGSRPISHVLDYLFTSASTCLLAVLPTKLEKPSKSRSQCSVKVLPSAHFFFGALRIAFLASVFYFLDGAKQVRHISPYLHIMNDISYHKKIITPAAIISLLVYTTNGGHTIAIVYLQLYTQMPIWTYHHIGYNK